MEDPMTQDPAAPSRLDDPARALGDPQPGDAVIRLRFAPSDARYGGDLVAGATAVALFGDLETELAIREYGDEGLCVAYHGVDFLAPLRAGDFVEGRARIVSRGRTSRRIRAELWKVIEADPDGLAAVLDPPVLAARAEATIVSGRRGRA
jgi:3-aminobutyryl-CoA ammonia-lyase